MKLRRVKKFMAVGLVVVALAVIGSASAVFAGQGGNGNGMPSGWHYNLNIIGVPHDKDADMTTGSGHRIFVPLNRSTKILLTAGPTFEVTDANGTKGSAAFTLPNPDPTNSGKTEYSVFARALGKPNGWATVTTCGLDPEDTSIELCNTSSSTIYTAVRNNGKPVTKNVSKELLYVWNVDILNADGSTTTHARVPLFDDRLEGYFWKYNNHGLRILQLRFYLCSTLVGDTESDPIDDSGFAGACFP